MAKRGHKHMRLGARDVEVDHPPSILQYVGLALDKRFSKRLQKSAY